MAERLNGKSEPQAKPGHNSGIAGDRLRSFCERIERLAEEKKALQADIASVFQEAKSAGFDTRIMREVIRERAMDAAQRQERDALLDTYRHALGILADTPLGESAIERVGTGAPV